ncbi:MAG TPA: helix-turn-helix domain-containing protein [Actinocrinis sp.]|jgi:DNA-binding PucR family transcriptional regulator|uniref:PucR family transcriptional regulator n=1 Tax=Actinocrinis sp. TaxID=1920516 RepID=UPI002DDD0693|nr:helix-turn-helix domain-containing protein [Actinocrinis sp.]HEV3172151.1 helix-turn-helix domain-containing protein [Actinocrinis sp.]
MSEPSQKRTASATRRASASRSATVRRLEKATGSLANAAIGRMEQKFAWYRNMPPENRSWVGLVAQAGIAAFTEWYRHPDQRAAVSADVFGTAPRELTRAVTLQQTVQMVRTTIEVVEDRIPELAENEEEEHMLREGMLRYSREIAFATAQVYAQAAELRGAWDARLEALVVDALLRGEADDAVRSRAAALGWGAHSDIVVIVGTAPQDDAEAVVDAMHRAGRHAKLAVLAGVQGDRLIAIVGGVDGDPPAAVRPLAGQFGAGPVVVGPIVSDLTAASRSAGAALSGLHACAAWPDAPRPVSADDLLPERALAGDEVARIVLVEEIYRPLAEAGSALLETLSVYLEQAASLEAAARILFVHPNTVRYRLRRVTDITGLTPAQARSAFTLQVALVLGRLAEPAKPL